MQRALPVDEARTADTAPVYMTPGARSWPSVVRLEAVNAHAEAAEVAVAPNVMYITTDESFQIVASRRLGLAGRITALVVEVATDEAAAVAGIGGGMAGGSGARNAYRLRVRVRRVRDRDDSSTTGSTGNCSEPIHWRRGIPNADSRPVIVSGSASPADIALRRISNIVRSSGFG